MSEDSFGYRRAYSRFNCFFEGIAKLADEKIYNVYCNDISYKGAGIVTDHPLKLNSHLKLELSSAKLDSLVMEGKVCWCNNIRGKWRAGVLFNRILPYTLEKIV